MRRADRLFRIVQALRRRRITTAARLAEELEVSERTVYRDIRDLLLSGVPIEGEAGVGYRLPKGFDLPPLTFNLEEIEALVLGARVVKSFSDQALGRAAQSVLTKVQAVLPERLQQRINSSVLFAPNFRPSPRLSEHLAALRTALEKQRKVELRYQDGVGRATRRLVRPLCLAFMPPLWMLAAWCELRQDFRNFRLDRIEAIALSEQTFVEEPGRSLEDFLRRVSSENGLPK